MLLEAYFAITGYMFILLVLCICNDTKNLVLPQLRGIWLFVTMVTISFGWPVVMLLMLIRAILITSVENSK